MKKIILSGFGILQPALCRGQGLDLGAAGTGAVAEAGSQYAHAGLAIGIFAVYLALGAALLGFLIFKKKKPWLSPLNLRELPDSAKTIGTLAIAAYGLVHIFAMLEAYTQTRVVFSSAAEYFFYMKAVKLIATSHAHLFGHATMYALTSLAFIFTSLSERWKVLFISLAMGAGLLDVPSWWMIKYAGGGFEAFSALAGAMSAAGWGFMAARIVFELWFQKESQNASH